MDLQIYRYFVVAAECQNFTQAAEKCYISQTAMSQNMSKLEGTLGFELFRREKRHVTLTPAGRDFYRHTKIMLSRFDKAVQHSRAVAFGDEGTIDIGFPSCVDSLVVMPRMQEFARRHPDIHLNILLMEPVDLQHSLDNEMVDLIVTWKDKMEFDEPVQEQSIGQFPLMAVVGTNHPYAEMGKIDPALLETQEVMVIEWKESSDSYYTLSSSWKQFGVEPASVVVFSKMENLLTQLQIQESIALLPSYVAGNSTGTIRFLELEVEPEKHPQMELVTAYHEKQLNPAMIYLISALSDRKIPLQG
jgi:LysR family transcriptional activator of glutamate synthase operon